MGNRLGRYQKHEGQSMVRSPTLVHVCAFGREVA